MTRVTMAPCEPCLEAGVRPVPLAVNCAKHAEANGILDGTVECPTVNLGGGAK